MKPYKLLGLFSLTVAIIVGVAIVFPADGIPIGSTLRLRFHWSFNSLNQSKTVNYADISNIISDSAIIEQQALGDTFHDSVPIDTLRASAVELRNKIQPIEYPAGETNLLYPFFNKLEISSKKLVRILHYGDSQIEGDRITGYLRNQFQKNFSGSGPGLLPAVPGNAESSSIIHHASNNWITHSVYYRKDTIVGHQKFGIMGSFARFTSIEEDSSIVDPTVKIATIEFRKSGMAYNSVNNFEKCRVFYSNNNSDLVVKGFVNDTLIWFEEINPTKGSKYFQWDFKKTPNRFLIQFESEKSPEIYAVALDAKYGVAVDNLPFRGSSGSEFTRLNMEQLSQMNNQLNSGLILYEFGVNVVPHQVKSYTYYEKLVTRQLNFLKTAFPNVPIIVIGISDMAQRNGEFYESYPNIESIKEAQRLAAKNTNCAFWDLYTAMGGKNSMPSWVFAEPSLASKDFIHFNRAGGHIVAQLLYNAIMQEYNAYLLHKRETIATQTNSQ